MKLNTRRRRSVDITHLPFEGVEALPDGGLSIGAVVRNSDLAYIPSVRKKLRRPLERC